METEVRMWFPKAPELASGRARIGVHACLPEKSMSFSLWLLIQASCHRSSGSHWQQIGGFCFLTCSTIEQRRRVLHKWELRHHNGQEGDPHREGSDRVQRLRHPRGETQLLRPYWTRTPASGKGVAMSPERFASTRRVRPANTMSTLSAHPRCCQWGNCSTPMCTTLSLSPSKTGPRSSTGTVTGPGKPAANPAKVSAFQLSLGDVRYLLLCSFFQS